MKKLVIFFFLAVGIFSSCRNNKDQAVSADEYYTCSMHPQVMESKPGTCPICHMDLIKVKRTQTGKGELVLNEEQERLGNIRVDTIRQGNLSDKLLLTATLMPDEGRQVSVNARVTGRIDRLYFRASGDFVPAGAHLYDLYSEALNNAKQEYLAALEKQQSLDNSIIDFKRLVEAARAKLLLWGMRPAQVDELARTKKTGTLTAFYSDGAGYITELPVMEGAYVQEGSTIMKLADLSNLWAEAQVYASQLSEIERSEPAGLQFPDVPGLTLTGEVSFVNPEISQGTRINLVRINVPNRSGQLKPGMPLYVTLQKSKGSALTLPMDAVLRGAGGQTVWVRKRDHTYALKPVTTGIESNGRIEIKSGLSEGDVVVTNGAYLVNSEYVFKQ